MEEIDKSLPALDNDAFIRPCILNANNTLRTKDIVFEDEQGSENTSSLAVDCTNSLLDYQYRQTLPHIQNLLPLLFIIKTLIANTHQASSTANLQIFKQIMSTVVQKFLLLSMNIQN